MVGLVLSMLCHSMGVTGISDLGPRLDPMNLPTAGISRHPEILSLGSCGKAVIKLVLPASGHIPQFLNTYICVYVYIYICIMYIF